MGGRREPRTIIVETDVVRIGLKQGYVAIVDRVDYDTIAALRDDAWCVQRNKGKQTVYARRHAPPGDPTLMHRVILQPPPGMQVNHRNFDGLDNRRVNLETCSHAENNAYQRLQRRAKSSLFKGVTWHAAGHKWRAYIKSDGQFLSLGLHLHEVDAARAYNQAAVELFGHYALLNEIPGEAIPNIAYQRVQRRAKSSLFKGVSWHAAGGKWQSQIQRHGQQIYLGLHVHEADAARAYNRAAVELFGTFALRNEIPGEPIPGAPT